MGIEPDAYIGKTARETGHPVDAHIDKLAHIRLGNYKTDEWFAKKTRRHCRSFLYNTPNDGSEIVILILDITDAALKARLADLCDHQPFIADAPVVLVFVADCQRWYDGFAAAGCAPRPPREGDLLLAAADAAIAAQNTVVAAESFGLGSCYIGDILENCEDVRSALALPPYAVPAAMLVLGRPTQQQRERRKPARFDARYIVRENRYRRMTPEEHEAMYRAREAAEGSADVDYAARMQAFCARKYNSVFSREMSRSAAVYLRAFSAQCTPGTEEGNARGVRRTENSHAGTD